MSLNNLFRNMMTRALRNQKRVPLRRHREQIGRLIEELEDRTTPAYFYPDYMIANTGSPAGSPTPPGSAFTPAELNKAYGINLIMDGGIQQQGLGQTVAIIDAYDDPAMVSSSSASFATSDLHKFDTEFGLPEPSGFFTKVNQTGGNSYPAPNSDWSVEISLDVEWVHAIAPYANILLVEANNNQGSNLFAAAKWAATNTPATAVTMSFGGGEYSGETGYDSDFVSPPGKGVTFFASTGDSSEPAGYPAYSPSVVAVGGTTLSVNGSGNYVSESVWGDGNPGDEGGGGGISQFENAPPYQNGLVIHNGSSVVSQNGYRAVPDVSSDADPNSGVAIIDSYAFGSSTPWIQVGGTSLSSPSWAALMAITDEIRANHGLGSLNGSTQTLPTLYNIYYNPAEYAADFHDVTTGSNGYSAATGYDLGTGIGTPVANNLVPALALGIPAGLTATLSGGNLTVSDTLGNADNITATVSGSNYVITDTLQAFLPGVVPVGTTLSNNNQTLTVPMSLAGFTGSLQFNLAGGNNTLTVDYSGGNFANSIAYNGGGNGTLDGLGVKGSGTQNATYTPSGSTPGSGTITSTAGNITFSNLTPVDMFGLATATVNFPNANDIVGIANGFDYLHGGTHPSLDVTGTSGGVGVEPVALWNDTNVTIDTTPVPGTDAITINSANNANNITNFAVTEPTGNGGTIAVNGTTTFPGSVSLTGGSISQTGAITATSLTTSTAQGTTLGAANAVGSFNATNTTSGNIVLDDMVSTLTITGVSQSGGGNIGVTNGGNITLTGNVTAGSGGNVSLTANTGLAVTLDRANVSINTLAEAQTLLTTPSEQIATYTATPSVINYLGAGGVGHVFPTSAQNSPNPAPFPGDSIGNSTDYFAVQATADVVIPSAGNWTFGVSSDDGFGLTVGPLNISFPNPRGAGDTFGTYNFPSAGVYPLNLVYYQQAGGDEVELFAAQGSYGSFNSNFELVGDTTDGGLALGTGAGAITQTGGVVSTTGTLTTYSTTGTNLPGSNTVNTFTATNTISGNVTLNNQASTLTIAGISQTGGGNVNVTNIGAIDISGNITAGGGNVNLAANSTVTLVRFNLQPNTLAQAQTYLNTPADQIGTYTGSSPLIDYLGGGGVGHTFPPAPQPFPGTASTGTDINNFAMTTSGSVYIPSAGDWTFGTSSDDGSQVTVGPLTVTNDNIHGPQDAFATYDFPAAGWYPLSLLFFQGPGGAEVQVFAESGTFNSFNSGFELIGDTTDGGLQYSTSANAGSIAETGGIVSTTGTLTANANAGITLNGANTVGTFNGTNGGGNLSLNNTANNFVISGIGEVGGTATVHNTGSTTINGTGITSTGNISVSTTGNLTVSSAVASSGGSTSLNFGSNNTGDTANINAPVTASTTATVTGGTGNDTITVNSMGATNLTVNGGGGTDQVTVNSGHSAGDPGTAGTGAVYLTDVVAGQVYLASVSGVGNDTIDVNDQNQSATSPPPAPTGAPVTGVPAITTGSGPAAVAANGVDVLNYSGTAHLTTLNLLETTGTNTYNIQYLNSAVVGSKLPPTVNIQTSTTTDTANLYGTAAGGSTFDVGYTTAGTTTATSLGGDAVTYPQGGAAYLATLNVYGRDKTTGDTFDVYPDAHTVVNIDAGLPSSGAGDTLILSAVGLTNPAIVPLFGSTSLPNGEITSSNKATLTWNSIETFPVPLGLGGTFDFLPVGSTTPDQSGFLPVTPVDTPTSGPYAAAADGWLAAGAGAFNRATPLDQPADSPVLSNLLTTGEWGYNSTSIPSANDGKFQVSVAPNQDVQVTTYIGDFLVRRDINVYVGTPGNPYETLLNPTLSTFTTSSQTYKFVSYSGVFNPGNSNLLVITFDTPDLQQYWTVEGLDVRPLGLIAPLTVSRVDSAPASQAQLANGLTVDQYTGAGAAPGAELTIDPTYGTPLNGAGQAVDFDPAVKGFQVQANAQGDFSFDILRPTGDGPSTITVTDVTGASGTGYLDQTGSGGLAVTPNPWLLPNPFVQQYTLPQVRRIDFGPLATPAASDLDPNNPNYLEFASAAYTSTAANALGWIGTAPTPYDRGVSYPKASPNNLQRDGVFGTSTPSDYELDMPATNTVYSVTVLLGDGEYAESGMSVQVINPSTLAVETVAASSVSTAAGQSCSITFPVETDSLGRIRLRFSTSVSSAYWTLQDIEVRPEVNTVTPPTGTQDALTINGTPYAGTSTGTGVAFSATALPGTVPADGLTITTYNISGAVPNSLLTIKTSLGTLNTADQGPTYQGIQVLASNAGMVSFSIISPYSLNATSATITVTAVTGGSIGVFTQNYSAYNPPATVQRFDFTDGGSTVQPGFTSVPNTTVYTPTKGYGWSTAVSGYYRGATSASGTSAPDLYSAGAWGQGSATFEVSVPVGSTDDARVYVGDPYAAWSGITVSADGGTPVAVDATIDRYGFVTVTGTDTHDTGILDITISGGIWVASGIDVAPTGGLPTPATGLANTNGLGTGGHESLEFVNSPVAAVDGYTGVSSTTTYASAAGYGWESAVSSFSRPASEFPASPPLSATQKVFYGNGDTGVGLATFEIAVPLNDPSATYSVRLYISDPYKNWPSITVAGEGGTPQTLTSSVGGYVTLNGLKDLNGDGLITITISSNVVWVLNGMDIVQNPTSLPPLPG